MYLSRKIALLMLILKIGKTKHQINALGQVFIILGKFVLDERDLC